MFPQKIKLIDEYIDLIVKKRKEHGLTAYQLSEQIGKNKSWIPNIENKRTKNISKNDFLLIFNDFAKEQHLSPEYYVLKNLSPNTLIELDNGTTIPCFYLQKELELFPPNFTKTSMEDLLKRFEYSISEKPLSVDCVSIKEMLIKFSNTILEELPFLTPGDRKKTLEAIKIMRTNFVNDFNITRSFYEVPLMHGAPEDLGEDTGKQLVTDLELIREKYVSSVELSFAKAEVYSYFDSKPKDLYTAVHLETYTGDNPKEISIFLNSIEMYLYHLYQYIQLSAKDAKLNGYKSSIEYYKLYSVANHALQKLIDISDLNYPLEFEVPSDDSNSNIIDKKQLELNNIVYTVKQQLSNKYNNDEFFF